MDDLKVFAVDVAARLPGWVFDDGYWEAYQHVARLVNPGIPEARVYLNATRQHGRVEVSGGYPNGVYVSAEQQISITVDPARAVDAVARDIERRFLGRYLEVFHAAMERAYQAALARECAKDVADELAAILGCSARHGGDASEIWAQRGKVTVAAGSNGPYISIERLYGMSVELAKEVVRVLARGSRQ